jgi:hypothetical protein
LPLLLTLARRVRLSPREPLVLGGVLLLLAVAGPIYFARHGVQRFEHINAYHRVFMGAALVAQDRPAALARLGIAPDRVGLVGTGYFKLSEADARSAAGATLWQTLQAYLAEPRAAARAAFRVARALAAEQTTRLGQFTPEESAGEARRYPQRAWHFSAWRKHALGSSFAVALLWLGAAGWVFARLRSGESPRAVAIGSLLAAVVLQALAVVLGDGFFALHRHLVGARLALDLALLLLIFDVAAVLVTRRRSPSARAAS